MSKKNRIFDASFKLEVAKMIKDQGMSVSQVCRDLNLGDTACAAGFSNTKQRSWVVPGLKPLTAEQQRIRELERQVRDLKMDNDILEKATAFFARELK